MSTFNKSARAILEKGIMVYKANEEFVFSIDDTLKALTEIHEAEIIDELETLIIKMNTFAELQDPPSKMLKYPNHMILNRLSELKSKKGASSE